MTEQTGVRVDPAGPDPSWPSPSSEPPPILPAPPGRRPRTLWVVSAALVAVALLTVLAWRAGAFGVRTDLRWTAAPGSTINAGPFELTFSELTLQKKQTYGEGLHYEVKVTGTGRTTGNESLAPRYTKDTGMFLARDDASGTIVQPKSMIIGSSGAAGRTFTPGLAPTPITVTFDFEASFQPQSTLSFAVIDQVLRDNSLLGNQDPEWRNGQHYFYYVFAVKRLPDDITEI